LLPREDRTCRTFACLESFAHDFGRPQAHHVLREHEHCDFSVSIPGILKGACFKQENAPHTLVCQGQQRQTSKLLCLLVMRCMSGECWNRPPGSIVEHHKKLLGLLSILRWSPAPVERCLLKMLCCGPDCCWSLEIQPAGQQRFR
jgi:hypothetical protein